MTAPLIATSVRFCRGQKARRAPPGDYTHNKQNQPAEFERFCYTNEVVQKAVFHCGVSLAQPNLNRTIN